MVQIWPGTGIGIVKPSPTNKYGYDSSSRKNIKHRRVLRPTNATLI